ncbi:MAG TPA: YihY/virulence factor BrkB family protein [Segeticoccus sp.]|nr:YihY/virulence factor BrkB family protein [Segeticoccus sp.]
MTLKSRVRRALDGIPGAVALVRLTMETIRVCLRYRVTGLASEAGFFALLSLPPLVFGLAGGAGYIAQWLGPATIEQITGRVVAYAEQFLTAQSVQSVIVPTLEDVLGGGRSGIISLGFVLSVWSGSRALNVFVDTISIMYGQSGVRGIVRTRILSLSLYLLSVLVGVVVFPLVLIGPDLIPRYLPDRVQFLGALYWPVVVLLVTASLTTLFHISTPRRSPWWRDTPGAVLALVIWILASFVLRYWLGASVGSSSTSIYGPLAAPIVVLIWLYFLAIAVLIGAALNAAIRRLWPVDERPSGTAQLLDWVGGEVKRRRLNGRRRPLTPLPEDDQRASRSARLDSGSDNRLMSVRTRNG